MVAYTPYAGARAHKPYGCTHYIVVVPQDVLPTTSEVCHRFSGVLPPGVALPLHDIRKCLCFHAFVCLDGFHFVVLVSGLCGYPRRRRPLLAVLADDAILKAYDIENIVNTPYTEDVNEFKDIFTVFDVKSKGPSETML